MKIIFLFIIAFVLFGCNAYRETADRCRKKCRVVQTNNVGANFMWRDLDMTYGKCVCISESGKKKHFYMSWDDTE